jgi:hypothetical protein
MNRNRVPGPGPRVWQTIIELSDQSEVDDKISQDTIVNVTGIDHIEVLGILIHLQKLGYIVWDREVGQIELTDLGVTRAVQLLTIRRVLEKI